MTRRPLRNVEASVRQRLLDQARAGRVPYEDLARRYAIERLLHRLALSPHRDALVLKGATLFTVWTGAPHRTTRDVDFLGRGTPDLARVAQVMHDLCRIRLADGLVFDETGVRASRIREEQPYLGARVLLTAFLGKSRIPLQIDVAFGDAVVPGTETVLLPSLLDMPAPCVEAILKETAIAEKFHAIVVHGSRNTRLKDYYDLWVLATRFDFRGETLGDAIRATFLRRGTPVPPEVPDGLSDGFLEDPRREAAWAGFLRRTQARGGTPSFHQAGAVVRSILWPLVQSIAARERFDAVWTAGGSWVHAGADRVSEATAPRWRLYQTTRSGTRARARGRPMPLQRWPSPGSPYYRGEPRTSMGKAAVR